MKLQEMMAEHRRQELIAIYKFILKANIDEVAQIISEIRVCHDNILVFNEKHKSVNKVKSVHINGECIQLNLEE
jgi:hypothetical protein